MPLLLQLLGAALVVGPLRVAAVDDHVAAVEQLGELVDRLLRGLAGGDHDPHDPRRLQLLDEVLQRARARGAVLDRLLDGLLVEVERDDLVVGVAADAVHHVAAHLAQPDETDLRHFVLLDLRGQSAQRAHGVLALQPHALRGQAELAQRLQVADRLGVLERRERVRRAGDLDVVGPVVQQLQEAPGLRAALVELAGRVQEARPVAERRRRLAWPPRIATRSSAIAASNSGDGCT